MHVFGSARGGKQGAEGFLLPVHETQVAAKLQQQFTFAGTLTPGGFVVSGGEGEFVALFGESGEFDVRAEVGGLADEGLLPAPDAFGEGPVDVLEGAFGGGVAGLADTVKDEAGFALLAGFEGEKGELFGDVGVGGVDAHGGGELVAGALVLTDLEERVGEVFANVDALAGRAWRLFRRRRWRRCMFVLFEERVARSRSS